MGTRKDLYNVGTFFLLRWTPPGYVCMLIGMMSQVYLENIVDLIPDHSNKVSHNLLAGAGLGLQFVKHAHLWNIVEWSAMKWTMPGGGKDDDEREWAPLKYRVLEKGVGGWVFYKILQKSRVTFWEDTRVNLALPIIFELCPTLCDCLYLDYFTCLACLFSVSLLGLPAPRGRKHI